jgi:hypothetical protein
MILENFDPIVKKVLVKSSIPRVLRFEHGAVKAGNLFRFRGKVNKFA